ncbi:bifunctional metallophosphatase/5'-nucleotidase [Fluviicola taffensis]|uniref:5'-Nucleotidase domain-containing protein n=1 Tax=Fluviicola taffensis (strain DSM 16823 / NCIMB 13979 / RW262) TaxID=755732 RepID=F2IJU2_FLUTR|nr:bifunctional metallophosphatase/5'-nucleotidase [Fluviicola taffensis]AEA45001.1 5'-Nucleotidase domain-containing protein [Fluviicola taffensis DSM 16823]
MKIVFVVVAAAVFVGCDQIKSPENTVKTITILQTSDIHAYLNPHTDLFVQDGQVVFREAGGLPQLKTLSDSIRKTNPGGTLLIDGGDLIQGSGASVRSQGKIFPPIIQAMNYDLLIPGNWEVIYGKRIMMEVMGKYKTNVIAANMFHAEGNDPLFPPYWVTERKGVKIGFIAYNDPEVPDRQNPAYSEGITFTSVEKNLQSLIAELKNEKKVDILFLVAHLGISKQIMLSNDPKVKGVDFILGNDTHERIRQPIKGKYAKVVEPGAFGSFLGKLELKVKNHKIVSYSYDLIEVNPSKYKADPHVQQLVDRAILPYKKEMQTVLGYTSAPIYRYLVVENPMDNFITDALRWKTGADFATSNGFRFGVPIVPDESGRAEITTADLWRMLPVNEHMKIGTVTGKQIKQWLEKEINNVFASNYHDRFGGWLVRFSGMTVKFNSSAKKGSRVESITIKGKPIEPDKTYKMASCNRTGEPISTMCRLKNAVDVSLQDYTLHDAVTSYLNEKHTVHPVIDGRAIATDLGPGAFSQMKEGNYSFR